MPIGVRPPDKTLPPIFFLYNVGAVIAVIAALLAIYLTLCLIFDSGSFSSENITDLTNLTGILWAVPTIIVAAASIGVRPPQSPTPPPPSDESTGVG